MIKVDSVFTFILLFFISVPALGDDDYQSKSFNQTILNLNQKFIDPSSNAHPLDSFHILSQSVDQSRQIEIERKINEIEAQGPYGEKIEHFVDTNIKARKIFSARLRLKISSADKNINPVWLNQKDLKNAWSPDFNQQLLNDLSGLDDVTFSLYSQSGQKLHQFHRPIQAITFYGQYLIYIEPATLINGKITTPIRFIDLEYFKGAIGNAPLPVYTIPSKINKWVDQFEIKNGALIINHLTLNIESFHVLRDFYQVYYNISVALVDPTTHAKAENLIKELFYFFNKALEAQDKNISQQLAKVLQNDKTLASILADAKINLQDIATLGDLNKSAQLVKESNNLDETKKETILKFIAQEINIRDDLKVTNRYLQSTKKFTTRLHMLITEMAHPPSHGSLTLLKSLILVANGSYQQDKKISTIGRKELQNHSYYKFIKYGSIGLASAALAEYLPAPYTWQIYQTLDFINLMSDQIGGYLTHVDYGLNYLKLFAKSAETAMTGPLHFSQAYLGEKLPKFTLGITSAISMPFIIFGIPHLIINSFKSFSAVLKDEDGQLKMRGVNSLHSFKQTFIDYQAQQKEYNHMALAKSESLNSGGPVTLSPTQKDEFDLFMQQLKADDKKGFLNNIFKNTFASFHTQTNKIKLAAKSNQRVQDEVSKQTKISIGKNLNKKKRIDTLGKALVNFLIGYSSLTNTYKFFATIWNYFYIMRSFALRPKTWYMALIYPKYFRVIITESHQKSGHFRSQFNGSLDNILTSVKRSFQQQDLLTLREYEKTILPFEAIVYEVALNKSLLALFETTDDIDRLKTFFDSTQIHGKNLSKSEIIAKGIPTTGLNSIADIKLDLLTSTEQAYFRAYFTKTFDLTLESFLKDYLIRNQKTETSDNISDLRPAELKEQTMRWTEQLKADLAIIKNDQDERKLLFSKISNLSDKIIQQHQINSWAKKISHEYKYFFKRRADAYHHDLFKALSPSHVQIKRFLNAEEQLENPKALARAVRSEVAALFINKPLQLLSLLIFYAGVDQGMLMPLHEEMFGPNSFFYMSRYLFYNGFAAGTVISIMSNTWLKVQNDKRIQETGSFDTVPMLKDQSKGFWRYYIKNLSNPQNKWLANQSHLAHLVLDNLPAYFITGGMINFIVLGRIDLGAFLGGLLMATTSPTLGFNSKLEQAFEIASGWVSARIPRKWRSLPEAQEYINNEIQKYKFKFNIGFESWTNIIGEIESIMLLLSTPEYGSRSFLRLIFWGYTPTELVTLGLRKVSEVAGFIPGVEFVSSKCEELVTKNFTDWEKVIPTKIIK